MELGKQVYKRSSAPAVVTYWVIQMLVSDPGNLNALHFLPSFS